MVIGSAVGATGWPGNFCQTVFNIFAANPKYDLIKLAINDIELWHSIAPEDFLNEEMIETVTGQRLFGRNVVRYLKSKGIGLNDCSEGPVKIGSLYIGPVNMYNCGKVFNNIISPYNDFTVAKPIE
eukprot:NODE_422_length_8880_cov_0.172759.p6 type:complete len:126 gc:universal NODE_422_length_8880_cov_0.172759:6280-6657(+)